MTELEEVFIISRAVLIEGQVAPGCRLTMGGDGRMVGCSPNNGWEAQLPSSS